MNSVAINLGHSTSESRHSAKANSQADGEKFDLFGTIEKGLLDVKL